MSSTNKGKKPKYQNEKEFSLLYKKDLIDLRDKTPKDHLCPRCFNKIDWKLKFGKYKKLTQPSKCHVCENKSVVKAYRTVCDKCCDDHKVCSMCGQEKEMVKYIDEEADKIKKLKLDIHIENKLKEYKECSRKKLVRLLEKETIVYENEQFIYVDSKEPVQNLRLKEKFKEAEDGEEELKGVDEEEVDDDDSGTYKSDDLDD